MGHSQLEDMCVYIYICIVIYIIIYIYIYYIYIYIYWLVVWNMNFIFPNSWDDDPI